MVPEERRIVILGGGFGGVFAAKRLERIFAKSKDVEIILISDQDRDIKFRSRENGDTGLNPQLILTIP